MDRVKIIFTTCASEKDAEKLSRALLKDGLAACCNIIPGVRSLYKWQGKIEDGAELILLIKTRSGRVADVMAAIEQQHGYDVPPIEVLSVEEANKAFQEWINAEVK